MATTQAKPIATTPGPWTVYRWSNLANPVANFREIRAGQGFYAKGFSLTAIISDADATLASASPDLFKALRAIVDYSGPCSDAMADNAVADLVFDALNKATTVQINDREM